MSSDYRKVSCPYCHALHNSGYRVDTPSEQVTNVHCGKCHKPFKIIHGNGHIRASK